MDLLFLRYLSSLLPFKEDVSLDKLESFILSSNILELPWFKFHFEIFGIKVKIEQFSKIPFDFFTFLVLYFEISDNSFNDEHP